MADKVTTEIFIERSKNKYPNRFDYSDTVYVSSKKRLTITCVEHESFDILPTNHMHGMGGCRQCMSESFKARRGYTVSEIIDRFISIHGDRYDYSLVDKSGSFDIITIGCKVHGYFQQEVRVHLMGCGCIKCFGDKHSKNEKSSNEYFLNRANEVHENKYDYSKSVYNGVRSKIIIGCPVHGDFEQIANNHLAGSECPICSNIEQRLNSRKTNDKFILDSKNKHNSFYSYDNCEYIVSSENVIVTCPIHGDFSIIAANHLSGCGCNQCSIEFSPYRRSDWVNKTKNRVGTFYIIRCFNETESFYKYGITSKGLSVRYADLKSMPYKYEIVRLIISTDKEYIWDLEKRFGRFKSKDKYKPLIKFAGCVNECFSTYVKVDRTR